MTAFGGACMIGRMKATHTVTIKDVAKLAGVSISTASRALSGAGGVRPELETKIAAAAAKLSYRPNAAARGLRNAKTSTMGIIFNNLSGPGQLDLLKGIGTYCNQTGYSLLSADANGDHDLYLRLMARFYEQRVEGLFLVSPIDLGESLADYRRSGVPVLALLRKDASAGAMPLVAASERHGIHDCVRELATLGHREMAYFLRFWDDHRARDIEDALQSEGLRPSVHSFALAEEGNAYNPFTSRVAAALRRRDRPTAVFVQSSLLGPTMRVLHELGLATPVDVSLVSLGASSWHQILSPGIAAVEADNQEIGRLACKVMLSWIEGSEPQQAYSELATWVRRASVGPAPAR